MKARMLDGLECIMVDGYRIRLCESTECKLRCRDLAYRRMLTPEYGLLDVAYARDDFDDVSEHTYLSVQATANGELVGTCRLRCNYDLSVHEGLDGATRAFMRHGARVADVGAYFTCLPEDQPKVFEGVFTACVELLLRREHTGLYIQSQDTHLRMYQGLGFRVIGPEFSVRGWATSWYPLLLHIPEFWRQHADTGFQQWWRAQTGRPLKVGLWKRVAEHLERRDLGPA